MGTSSGLIPCDGEAALVRFFSTPGDRVGLSVPFLVAFFLYDYKNLTVISNQCADLLTLRWLL